MAVNPEYIEQLVLDEIAGIITPEDSATLKEILAQEPEALVIRDDLYAQYGNHPSLDHLADTLPVEKVWEGIRKKKSRYVLIKTISSIAAVSLLLIGSYILFPPGRKQPAFVREISPKNIELQLPNGQKVNLGNTQQQIKLNNLTLSNQQKKLSWDAPTGADNRQATLTVPPGKDYAITLPDGTEIQLNAATRIQFPFAFRGSTRDVTINGEAYLKVAKDPSRPFRVHLPNSTVQVLGTEFNVNTYDSGHVDISLVSGAVQLHTSKDSILLHPGYAVSYQSGKEPDEAPFDAEDVLSWRQGVYVFHNATLAEMSGVIHRWFGISVTIDNPTAARRRFRGFIDRKQSVRPFLEGLKFTGQFDYYFDKDSVLHMQ